MLIFNQKVYRVILRCTALGADNKFVGDFSKQNVAGACGADALAALAEDLKPNYEIQIEPIGLNHYIYETKDEFKRQQRKLRIETFVGTLSADEIEMVREAFGE